MGLLDVVTALSLEDLSRPILYSGVWILCCSLQSQIEAMAVLAIITLGIVLGGSKTSVVPLLSRTMERVKVPSQVGMRDEISRMWTFRHSEFRVVSIVLNLLESRKGSRFVCMNICSSFLYQEIRIQCQ